MTKIGIIGAGTGALPPEVLKMAEEANVEIVELPRKKIRGFSLDIRIYPLTLLRQSIKTIKS